MKLIEIIRESIPQEVWEIHAKEGYGDFVKIVVDVERSMIGLGGEFHADAEQVLLDEGSEQKNLWGANVYITRPQENRLEYTSLINIRPRQGNRSTMIEDDDIKKEVRVIVDRLLLS